MLAVQLVLASLLVVAGLSLVYPSPPIAVVLAALSGAWLPVNNGHLEGPTIYTVAEGHGLTVADLGAYAGFALAALAGWRWRQARLARSGPEGGGRGLGWPSAVAFLAVLVFLLGCGLAASWLDHKDHVSTAGAQGSPAAGRGLAAIAVATV
jgi:hypothetical protein